MPIISGLDLDEVLILLTFLSSVLAGRNQLLETMNESGAGTLICAMMPKIARAMHRTFVCRRQGRRREYGITVEMQMLWNMRATRRVIRRASVSEESIGCLG